MPDVFKILKDLELKAVGLDPATNKMQEGYFVAFREIGLPIHKEDFENPFSPLGSNLEKDIPKTNPSDPKDAPKTASAQLDEDKVFTANIAHSQQAYLNAFLLTDDKLRMNNSYSIIPGSSKVSDSWWAITIGANGIPTTNVLNDSMKKAYEDAQAKLMAQGMDPAIALISRAQKRFVNSLNEFQGIGEIPDTILLPNSWYDPDEEDGWYEYNSNDFHSESDYQASSTAYSGSTKLGLSGLFSFIGNGSLKKAENQSSIKSEMNNLKITFKYCIVDIKRPWLDASLLNLSNWFLMGDYKKGCISNGTMAQELPENALEHEHTFFPSAVTSLILTKDVSIEWDNWQQDWKSATEHMDVDVSIGFSSRHKRLKPMYLVRPRCRMALLA